MQKLKYKKTKLRFKHRSNLKLLTREWAITKNHPPRDNGMIQFRDYMKSYYKAKFWLMEEIKFDPSIFSIYTKNEYGVVEKERLRNKEISDASSL